ncbi:MAG: dienelactone hydrolase family protein [Actinomycetota bacterium]|nr:dienelactone hydrolase family protein [Actinomycetota bacterium]
MGQIVEFPSNGSSAQGYLALPEGTGPGLVVIQEWWGLVDHIKDVADRFAQEGFVALAPDLYHGKATAEPDEARKLAMDLELEDAARDMSGAVEFLIEQPRVEPKRLGAVGFCMGGSLALFLATQGRIDAAVPFYGIPSYVSDYAGLAGPVLLHLAEHDQTQNPRRDGLERAVREAGQDIEVHVYPEAHHGFFNDTTDAYDPEAGAEAWSRTVAFFRTNLT